MGNNNLQNILNSFNAFDLKTLNDSYAQNRYDFKFIIPNNKLIPIINALKLSFSVLAINQKTQFKYQTTYYDTENYDMYNNHHRGKFPRYKIRIRTYNNIDETNMFAKKTQTPEKIANMEFHPTFKTQFFTDETYLEIKKKNNNTLSEKYRIKLENISSPDIKKLINTIPQITPYQNIMLQPTLKTNYTRITFLNLQNNNKITIDNNIFFSSENKNKNINEFYILEYKTNKKAINQEFRRLLKENGIYQTSFSKYCFGLNYTHHKLKKNNFVPILKKLQKQFDINYE